MGVEVSGCVGVWDQECEGVRVYSYLGARVYRCSGVCKRGCVGGWV